jgi:hypothetical protein
MKKNSLYILAMLFIFMNCTVNRVVQNPSTTVEKIFNLREGMPLTEVASTLGIDPRDVYSIIENQTKVLVYTYKLEYQQINAKFEKDEQSLRGGPQRFKDENDLYVVFDASTNKMLYYVTDKGRKNGSRKMNEALKLKLMANKKNSK